MADSKMNEKEFKNKLNSLIKEYKKAGKVQYDELNKQFAKPMNLNADQMDKIIEHVEDAGISVKQRRRLHHHCHPGLKLTIRFGCT